MAMSQTYLFGMSDGVGLELCTKEPYVEGSKKTVRKTIRNGTCGKKRELLICCRCGPLMLIGIYTWILYTEVLYMTSIYIEAYIDIYTALYLYIRPAPCAKEPYVEGDRKTVRTSTKKRHFRVDLANVSHFANICFLSVGCCFCWN